MLEKKKEKEAALLEKAENKFDSVYTFEPKLNTKTEKRELDAFLEDQQKFDEKKKSKIEKVNF